MSVIFPVVQLLNKSYSRKNYDELLSIKSNYAIRYLGKKERRTLMLLIEQYSIVCQYNRSKKDTDCILSYFDFKLGEIGINPKPCPITDDEVVRSMEYFVPQVGQNLLWQRNGTNLRVPH